MTENKITLDTAIQWTTNWRDKNSGVKAFLIPAQDLTEVLNELKDEKGQKYVRAYLAIDEAGTEKLVIVGTQYEKITASDGKILDLEKDLLPATQDEVVAGEYGIYDFVKPCPTYCDPESPLNYTK